jgi:hypothetical protein
MELLLLACSTYDKKTTLPGNRKDPFTLLQSPLMKTSIGTVIPWLENTVFKVDTDVGDLMVHYTNANHNSNTQANGIGKPKSNFIPREEWIKLSQDQKDQLVGKRRQEMMKDKPLATSSKINQHKAEELLNLDDLIEYAAIHHSVTEQESHYQDTFKDNALLAHMAGIGLDTSPGDIRQVIATDRTPGKNKTRKANKSTSVPNWRHDT